MPLLSEILAAETFGEVVYGIVPDTDDVTPPAGLREAGVVSSMPGGEIEEVVLDIVISYILAGISTTIEIPAEVEIGDPKHLMSTAASIGASLSLLPPKDSSDEAFEAYVQRLEELARAYTTQANFTRFVVPVTSYLEYLFIEVLKPDAAAEFKPVDAYVIENFASAVTVERADAMKARLRGIFYEAHGGEEGFIAFAKTLFSTIYARVEETCQEESSRLKGDNPSDPIGNEPTADIA